MEKYTDFKGVFSLVDKATPEDMLDTVYSYAGKNDLNVLFLDHSYRDISKSTTSFYDGFRHEHPNSGQTIADFANAHLDKSKKDTLLIKSGFWGLDTAIIINKGQLIVIK